MNEHRQSLVLSALLGVLIGSILTLALAALVYGNAVYEWQCTSCTAASVYSQFTVTDSAFADGFAVYGQQEVTDFTVVVNNGATVLRLWDLHPEQNGLTQNPNHWVLAGDAGRIFGIGLRNDSGDFYPLGWGFDHDPLRADRAAGVRATTISTYDVRGPETHFVTGYYARRFFDAPVVEAGMVPPGVENIATPEPASWGLMLLGLLAFAWWQRRGNPGKGRGARALGR